MYLSIGAGVTLESQYIVGIFDLDRTTHGIRTREFLSLAQKRGQVVTAGEDLPKSFLLYEEKGKITIYLSQLSVATLQKRRSSI